MPYGTGTLFPATRPPLYGPSAPQRPPGPLSVTGGNRFMQDAVSRIPAPGAPGATAEHPPVPRQATGAGEYNPISPDELAGMLGLPVNRSGGGSFPSVNLRPPNQPGSSGRTFTQVPGGNYPGPTPAAATAGPSPVRPPAIPTPGSRPPPLDSYQAPSGVSRSGASSALDALGRPVSIDTGSRATLGGPAADNQWEQMAAERYGAGFDPGAGQFQGRELVDEIFTPAQINQMAQQRAAPQIASLADTERLVAEAVQRSGGRMTPGAIAALKARASMEGAGAINAATRDAQLDATAANAEQAARAAANTRENFSADLAARLGLGGMELNAAGDLLSGGLQRRGQDQARDIERYGGQITQRGQDIGARTSAAELNTARATARARGEIDLSEQALREQLGIGEQELAARGQNLSQRGQDINRELAIGELDMTRYRTQADLGNAAAERGNRLEMLDRQLADSRLDRETRATLERERNSLTRELEQLRIEEQRRQFDTTMGFNENELAQRLGLSREQMAQNQSQFDSSQQFAGEQGRLGRNLTRQTTGVVDTSTPQAPQSPFQFTQPFTEDGRPRTPANQTAQQQEFVRMIMEALQRQAA